MKKLLVCINNYNKDGNALKLYSFFSEYFDCKILDTYHLDNDNKKLNCENVIYLHNVYCGGLFKKDYELFKEADYDYILIVESDVIINDKHLIDRIKLILNDSSESIYAYSPSLLSGSSCEGTSKLIIQNAYGFNNKTNRMRDTYRIEGWFALYHKNVADAVLGLITDKNCKFGWGVHECCSRYAITSGKRCVIDDVVSVYHTPGCGYSQKKAFLEGELFKKEVFNKLNLYYIDEKKD